MRPLIAFILLSTFISTHTYADDTIVSFGSNPLADTVETTSTPTAETESNISNQTSTTSTEARGRTRTITISTRDRFGKIEESLTPAIHSEARYVTNGGSSYTLVGTGQNRTNTQREQLLIPSWKVFAW